MLHMTVDPVQLDGNSIQVKNLITYFSLLESDDPRGVWRVRPVGLFYGRLRGRLRLFRFLSFNPLSFRVNHAHHFTALAGTPQ